jgi:serine/threonine-protein kinase Chk2
MCVTTPTIDISDYTQAPEHEETEGNEDDEVWGRLFPLGSDWSGIDLIDDDYTFGRSDDCDYCFEEKGCRSNSHFRTFSNVHFKIYKQKDNSNYIIFLQDKSTNGTFINGEKVGKNNSVVLNHDDEISLSMNKNKSMKEEKNMIFVYIVFIFNAKDRIEKNNHLPKEFKEKYTMSKLIGKGACGEVNLAFEKNSCKKFAVKIIGKKTFSVGVRFWC